MKNLKRLMSVVLSVVMLLSFVISTSAATFTDVAESDKAFDAVEILAALKILEGKEAGVFDPDANIKRSEFAAVICRAMNQSPVGVASFTDVATDHWAYNYIAWAASQKIVNGRGDGTFDPDANVTYNEAIAMIVRAMGYEYYVEEYLGGFPTGYARVAGSYKIDADVNTTNGNAAATRADVASLVYNAFDAPLMDYSYAIGSDMEYVIYDGSENVKNEKRTLLSYYSDIYKFKATVGTTSKSNTKYNDNQGNRYLDLTVLKTYGFKAGRLEDALGKSGIEEDYSFTKILANNADWADYSGYTVDAYITVNDDEKLEVIAMVPVTAGEEVVIANAREAVVSADVNLVVYDDEDGVEQEIDTIDADATVYVNKIALGSLDDQKTANKDAAVNAVKNLAKEAYAEASFVDSDNDGDFDKIYLIQYTYAIVEEVDAEYETIKASLGYDVYLSEDETKPGFTYAIYKDGNEIGLEDLVAGDVLNMVIGGTDMANATFADIYVTNTTVESSIASFNPSTEALTIDGEEYYTLTASSSDAKNLTAGDAGVFYISIDGYILDVDYTSTHSDNYAMILDLGSSDSLFGGGKAWQIKLLTKNNEIKTLPVKSTLFVTDVKEIGSTGTYEIKSREPMKNTDLDTFMGKLVDYVSYVGAKDAEATAVTELAKTIANRMVTFKEANGEITELVLAADVTETSATPLKEAASDRAFTMDKVLEKAEYADRSNRLANDKLLDSTVLFNLPLVAKNIDMVAYDEKAKAGEEYTYKFNADKAQVYAASSLSKDMKYNGFVYDNEKAGISAALLIDEMSFAGNTNALALVASIATGLDAEGNQADIVTFVQAGETKSLVLNEDVVASGADLYGISVGDVFQYDVNAAGEIATGLLIYDFDTDNDASKGITAKLKTPTNGEVKYIAGIVADNDGSDVQFVGADSWYSWNLDDEGTNAVLDVERLGKASAFATKNTVSHIRQSSTKEFDDSKTSGKVTTYNSDAYVIVAKYVDYEITDVVAYRFDKEYFVTSAEKDDKIVYTVNKSAEDFAKDFDFSGK